MKGTAGYTDVCRWVPEDYVAQLIAEQLRTRWNAKGISISDEDLRIRIEKLRARHAR